MRTTWKLLRNKTNLTFLLSLTFMFLFSGCMRGQETVKKKYYDNGKLKRETHFKNGEIDGLDTWFYETGEKMFEVHVKNRRAEGLRTTWFESGKKKSEAHFKNGQRDGLFTKWSITGEKKIESHYKNGKKDGLETYWYTIHDRNYPTEGHKFKQGNKRMTQYYKDGLLHGTRTDWDEDGKKIQEINYVDGREEILKKR